MQNFWDVWGWQGGFWPGRSWKGSVEEVGWAVLGPAEMAEQDTLKTECEQKSVNLHIWWPGCLKETAGEALIRMCFSLEGTV